MVSVIQILVGAARVRVADRSDGWHGWQGFWPRQP
jgi:hypothetical protein